MRAEVEHDIRSLCRSHQRPLHLPGDVIGGDGGLDALDKALTEIVDAGNGVATFNFKQTGEALSGTYSGTLGQAQVTGTIKGDQAEWTFENDQVGKVSYKGTLDAAGKMKGSVVYGQLGAGTFTAEKKT